MTRYLVGLMCVLALGVVGCSETSGTGGSGSIAGTGGEGGAGGYGGGMVGCVESVCPCSEAGILAAIEAGGKDPYTFDCAGPKTVVTEAEIVIDNDVVLDGEGKLTVDGDDDHRVFSVPEGANAELRRLTVTNGFERTGGGVANEGTLTIHGCLISDNRAEAAYDAGGGGIRNAGQMTIIDSTVSENHVTHGEGGGIVNWHSATLVLVKSTVSHNSAGIDGTGPVGGGIRNAVEMTIINSAVSENSANGLGGVSAGGIYSSGRMTLTNSTISANLANRPDSVAGVVASDAAIANTLIDGDCEIDSTLSQGYNIESPGDTCGFDQLTDQPNVSAEDVNVGELADNGGPTMTHALLPGSVATDAIPADMCGVDEDQRGEPRPGGVMCDVGAFEVQP